ncbi:MAG TPA: DUF1573 domain-containing protein [Anaerolineae bacterium]|jgi:hypothetical protein|nr:DUF1573 domain-containing protein [Anaerolineae bacterium]
MSKVIFFAVILLGFLLAACSSGQPNISVEETSLDLGDVVNGKIVSRDLFVRNNGEADLVVESIITSCTCTKATVDPMTIGANESGTLHIEFDSGFHGPDLTGPLIRQVFINSNDPQQPELQVELVVNVEARDGSSG